MNARGAMQIMLGLAASEGGDRDRQSGRSQIHLTRMIM
jgi:hypothetical protein